MEPNSGKKIFFLQFLIAIIVLVYCIHISGCGSISSKTAADKKNEATNSNKKATTMIKNDRLFPFLFGGIYFLHGYGGAAGTFDMIKPEMEAKPGTNEFCEELDSKYTELLVYPYKKTEMADMKKGLSEYWGVNNKTEMLETLNWLLTEGHQKQYLMCRKAIEENGGTNANIQQINLSKYELTKDDIEKLNFVKKHFTQFSASGIKAWDYARYVNNIAMGYAAGYLSESEGNDLLKKIVLPGQKDYDNWKAYFSDFELGRSFWSGDETDNEYNEDADNISIDNAYNIYKYMPLK